MVREKKLTEGPASDPEMPKPRRSLRPLARLVPYVFLHKGMVAIALAALVASAGAMLALPMGVRRMTRREQPERQGF